MHLDTILKRCTRLEERAAGLYRAYAAASRAEPVLCALWTTLAREEEEHARSITLAAGRLEPSAGLRTRIDGWDEALAEVEECLTAAEQGGAGVSTARQLSAALALETSELEALRHVVLAACDQPDAELSDEHALRLAEAAERLSDDTQVRLQAALLRARLRLKKVTPWPIPTPNGSPPSI